MELLTFRVFSAVAVIAGFLCITRKSAVASALWLIITLFALAGIFVILDAHFIAAVQVLVYAGAIMVLFLFVIMMLNLGQHSRSQEKSWLSPRIWIAPSVMVAILLAQLINALSQYDYELTPTQVGVMEVSALLFGPYVLAVELAYRVSVFDTSTLFLRI